jgi:hypothetical protein
MSLPTPVFLTTKSTPVTRAASHGFFGEGANYVAGNHHSPRLFSRGRAALLSRASCTSFLAAPVLLKNAADATQLKYLRLEVDRIVDCGAASNLKHTYDPARLHRHTHWLDQPS